jgi:hypothetical protein
MKICDIGFDQWFEAYSSDLHQKDCCFACVFRSKPATNSVSIRPGIPVESGH